MSGSGPEKAPSAWQKYVDYVDGLLDHQLSPYDAPRFPGLDPSEARRMFLYGAMVRTLHETTGLTSHIADRLRVHGFKYQDFYVSLYAWFTARPETTVGIELARLSAMWERAYGGDKHAVFEMAEGDTAMHENADAFYEQLAEFLDGWPDATRLINEQRNLFSTMKRVLSTPPSTSEKN